MAYGYKRLVTEIARRDAAEWVEELLEKAGYHIDPIDGAYVYMPYKVELCEHMFGYNGEKYPNREGYNYRVELMVQRLGDEPLKALVVEGAVERFGNKHHIITDKETGKLLWASYKDMREMSGITEFNPWKEREFVPLPDNGIRNEDFLDMNAPALF